MEIIDKIIAIIYSMLILVNAVYLRKLIGTWLFPGCIFCLFWFCYTFFPLVVLFEVPVNPNAVAFMTVAVLLFSSTFFLFNWKVAYQDNLHKPKPARVYDTNFLRVVLAGSILISVVGSFIHLFAQGISLMDLFTNPIAVASKFADARYNDGLNYTVFGPISLLFSNVSVIVGGLIFGSVEAKKNKKLLFAFLPSLIILLTQSSKGLFFQSVFLFLGSILVTRVYANQLQTFNWRGAFKFVLVLFGFFILLAVSFLSRGLQDIKDIGQLAGGLRSLFATYFFTHVYGFSDWFTAYTGGRSNFHYDTSDYHMGFYTLMAFFKMLGSDKVTSAGIFDETFMYKDLLDSNIFTMFRGMIMDFGLLGALVFMVLNGLLINLMYYLFLRRHSPVFTVVLVIFMIDYFYLSFAISLLTWAIIPVTFLVCYLILKLNSYDFVLKPTVKE